MIFSDEPFFHEFHYHSFPTTFAHDYNNSWVLFSLTILSWVFSVVTLTSCDFLIVDSSNYGMFGTYTSNEWFGLFKANVGGSKCYKYSDFIQNSDLPSAHRTARAFGVLANLLLVFAFVGISLVMFVLRDKPTRIIWHATRICYVLALIAVLLTFSFFATPKCDDENCILGIGGIMNVVNGCILVYIVATCWYTPVPDEPVFKCVGNRNNGTPAPVGEAKTAGTEQVGTTITRTIEIKPQGRVTTEVTVHPDGTKATTTTVEENPMEATEKDDEV